jgi:uncharacterized membrane protein (UPF0127 family)
MFHFLVTLDVILTTGTEPKSMSKKDRHAAHRAEPQKSSNNKPYIAGGIFVLILFVVYLVGNNLQRPNAEPVQQTATQTQIRSSVEFVKQGELRFFSKKNVLLSTVDIEIASNEAKRMQGLMYRDSMAESQAMLFIFPDEDERSFWMKNTVISLDIIYVNTKNVIVSIQKNAIPYSEDSVPSNGKAKYVVEVNAGFCERHSIRAGDRIDWKRL